MSDGSPNNDANNQEPPMDGSGNDAVQEIWESGLRRRRRVVRGSSSRNNDNGNEVNGNNNNYSTPRRPTDDRSRNATPRTPSTTLAGNNLTAAAGIGDPTGGGAPPCGGSGAVGVLTSPAGAASTMGPAGGAPSNAPFKTPSKDAPGMVAAATPSSITTAGETAESTLFSQSPLSVRRRRRRSGRPPLASAPSLRRQYRLLQSQILLLLGSASVGLVLFLFYALPLAAFVSLGVMASSVGALVPVARSIVRARYEMELEHPLGLTRYLPESLRVLLTETTLHEFMTDTAFMIENRYLLLYFVPGLRQEQLMEFIDRLPSRHREALLRPGLGRMMPAVMENLMRMENNAGGPNITGDSLRLENGDDASSASGLTVDREHHEENDGNNEADTEVTLLDVVAGLPRTLGGFALDNQSPSTRSVVPAPPTETPAVPSVAMQGMIPPTANPTPSNGQNYGDNQDDDNSSFDFSIDLSEGLNNVLQNQDTDGDHVVPAVTTTSDNNAGLRNVIVELPQPSSDSEPNRPEDQNHEEIQQREYDLEGTILSEAASAAVANYMAQASSAVRETTTGAMDSTSTWIIRAGSWTGLIAGGGGIVAAILANHRGGVTLGSMSGLMRGGGGVNGSDGGANNDAAPDRQGWYSSAAYGLFASSAFGFAGAGVAYMARNRVRAAIAANREKRLKDESERDDEADES